jgi:hypothetical protein
MLGKGGFAKCYEVTNMDNKKVLAAKIIAKSSLKRKRAKQKVKANSLRFNNYSYYQKLKSTDLYHIQMWLKLKGFLKIKKMSIF